MYLVSRINDLDVEGKRGPHPACVWSCSQGGNEPFELWSAALASSPLSRDVRAKLTEMEERMIDAALSQEAPSFHGAVQRELELYRS